MGFKKITTSFSGGEVTPEFWGQANDAKFQSGLAECLNMIVLPHGPIQNRAGTAYVNTAKDSAARVRLIPFTYSTTQTMVLEFGAGYIRFHTQGATVELYQGIPLEVTTPYTGAQVFDIHYVQSADVLTLVHPEHPPRELRRNGPTTWTLADIGFVPSLTVPTGVGAFPAQTASPTNLQTYNYVVTSVGDTGLEESAQSQLAKSTPKSISAITNANPGVFTTSAAHYLIPFMAVEIANAMAGVTGTFKVRTVPSSTTFTVAVDDVAAPISTTLMGTYAGGGTVTPIGCANNLFETGAYNTVAWSSTGAARYNVYKQSNGLFGYIGQTDKLTFKDDNITAQLSKAPPVVSNPFGAATKYPGAVSYFEQRRCFAGSIAEPQNLRMTRSGTESNMAYSIPVRDDDAINIRVAAREANTIRHIVPLQNLVLLTGAAEWRVTSINSDAITPTSISVKPQSYIGANNVQPVIVNNNILYVASRGGHLREMAFSYQAGGYTTGDLSLRTPHLFDGVDVVDLTFVKAPYPILWAISSSGKLLGLTYVPEQQIGAWHQHDTQGTFESCCVVAEGAEDALYLVAKRKLGGQMVRTIERMASRSVPALANAFFVDCGITYRGAPTTTLGGLNWLDGQTVNILGDGAVFAPQVVKLGIITLEQPCSVITVGLPITSRAKTLPLYAQIDAGLGQGRLKNVNKAWLRVVQSSGIKAGPSTDKLVAHKQRTNEPYGSPPNPKTEEIEIVLSPSWQSGGQVVVQQTDPLPMTLVSITLDVELGG